MDITKYLLRCGGSSYRVFTLPPLASLEVAEQLMASLLSRVTVPDALLCNVTKNTIQTFLDLVIENELAGYILESICLAGLESRIRELRLTSGDSETDVFTLISRQSAVEAIKFEKFDTKFVNFLDLSAQLAEQIVWLKGIVTSRTCYSNAALRLSSDFDCFVDRKYLRELNQILSANDFHVIAGDTGFCNQLGVGPVKSLDDLFLVPSSEFVPSAVVGYLRKRSPLLDIKFNPLDRGLKMIEQDRFERDSVAIAWRGRHFVAPSLLDQLIVTLTHLEKDRFVGWKQLLDIKLLSEKISQEPENWKEFVRRCKVEGVSTACCAGLSLARDRLALTGIDHVIDQTNASKHGLARRTFTFTVTPLFYWNTSSLPMLMANAAVSDDALRKMNVLKASLCPDKTFLSSYYFGGRELNLVSWLLVLFLHWLVLILPGGVIRRTFGFVFLQDKQFGGHD